MARPRGISDEVIERACALQAGGMKWRLVAIELGLDEDVLKGALQYQRRKGNEKTRSPKRVQ